MLSLLLKNQSHSLQKLLVICLFGLDRYVDIASMYHLHQDTDHSLWPAACCLYIYSTNNKVPTMDPFGKAHLYLVVAENL